MPPKIKAALTSLSASAGGFSVAQKTIAGIGAAVLLMGGIFLYQFMTKPAMTPLFSGLSSADANAVVEQLRANGVAYEITGGGGTIMVPDEAVYEERMKAATAGIPAQKTGGYSLLDDMGVTSSEFQQDVTYKRALEGELAATIGSLDGVQNASVQLALPESTVFVAEKGKATASVFVETQAGRNINDDQVQAIVHLTSAAIDGLDAENVAVIDSQGNVLSAVGTGATGSADKQASDYEARVAASVQSMLDRVVGSGNATVAVAADMNYESGNRTAETFTGAGEDVPALNEQSATEQYTGGGGPNTAAGVLGPDNIAVPGDAADDGEYTSESTTRNNAVNKVTETTVIPAGTLNRQTVSVAISRDAAAGINQAALMGLVRNAAGIDAERGDAVTLEILPFNNGDAAAAQEALAAAEEAAAAERQAELIRNLVTIGSVVLAVLILLVIFALRSRRTSRQALDLAPPMDLGELDDGTTLVSAIPLEPTPTTNSIPVIEPLAQELSDAGIRREQVQALAVSEPAKTAEYLRALIDNRTSV
ncbi:MAG: flagellar basal-body MS-ring/collar protein FliF [Arthrobacter sp.]